MVCFCKTTAGQLAQILPELSDTQAPDPDGDAVQSIADWVAAQPDTPWSPEPDWTDPQLPPAPLPPESIARISVAAYLRALVLAQPGVDLLDPAQTNPFIQLTATLSARLAAMPPMSGPDAGPALNATMTVIDRVEAALTTGVFESPPPQAARPFVRHVRDVLPITLLPTQLGLDLTTDFTAELADMAQAIVSVPMPQMPVVSISLLATLSASLTAITQLSTSPRVNPLEAGLPAAQAMITDRQRAVEQRVRSVLGSEPQAVADSLPSPDDTPFVTPAAVSAVMAIRRIAERGTFGGRGKRRRSVRCDIDMTIRGGSEAMRRDACSDSAAEEWGQRSVTATILADPCSNHSPGRDG